MMEMIEGSGYDSIAVEKLLGRTLNDIERKFAQNYFT